MEDKKEISITFNAEVGSIADEMFPRIKEYITEVTEPYKNAIVSEDGISQAKKDRAALNSLLGTIDNERKRIKKMWLAPYAEWEGKLKDSISDLNEAIGNIGSQIQEYENGEKKKKRAMCIDLILEDAKALGDEVKEVLGIRLFMERVWKESYCLKSIPIERARKAWNADLGIINSELKFINGSNDETLKAIYYTTANLPGSLRRADEVKHKLESLKNGSESTEETKTEEDAKPTLVTRDCTIVKASRCFTGEKWKVLQLLAYAEELGLSIERI